MKVCLINPVVDYYNKSFFEVDPLNNFNDFLMSPLGLGYLASVLSDAGHEVHFIDMMIQSVDIDFIMKLVTENNISFVGISSYLYNMRCTFKMINRLKLKIPNIFIATGGYLPTFLAHILFDSTNIDCCIIGEGEETLKELVQKLQDGEAWNKLDGIAYKSDNNITYTKRRSLINDLDSLPFPQRIFTSSEMKSATVTTSRGCYGNCNYCSIIKFYKTCEGKQIRRRSPKNVVKELKMLQDSKHIRYVAFYDDNFAISSKSDRKWFDEFYFLIKENKINLNYWCDIRANEVVSAPDILEKFVEIGLTSITIGVESFSQTQLDFFNKNMKVSQNIRALQIVNALDIEYTLNLIYFDPRSTLDELIESINTIMGLDFLFTNNKKVIFHFANAVIAHEGTDVRKYVNEKGLFNTNNRYYQFVHPEIEMCLQVKELWDRKIGKLYEYNFLYDVALNFCENHFIEIVLKLLKKISYLDYEAFLYICNLIKEGNDYQVVISKLEQKFEFKLMTYKNDLIKITKRISSEKNITPEIIDKLYKYAE